MTLAVFLVFFETQDLSNDDQCVLKSCYMPEAVLNAFNICDNPVTSVLILTSLYLITFNQKNGENNS